MPSITVRIKWDKPEHEGWLTAERLKQALERVWPRERIDITEVRTVGHVAANEEIERLRQWVDDLQSGMYVNCVYCGHRYGPKDEVPATMAQVLHEHIRVCPVHPLRACEGERDALRDSHAHAMAERGALREALREMMAAELDGGSCQRRFMKERDDCRLCRAWIAAEELLA